MKFPLPKLHPMGQKILRVRLGKNLRFPRAAHYHIPPAAFIGEEHFTVGDAWLLEGCDRAAGCMCVSLYAYLDTM